MFLAPPGAQEVALSVCDISLNLKAVSQQSLSTFYQLSCSNLPHSHQYSQSILHQTQNTSSCSMSSKLKSHPHASKSWPNRIPIISKIQLVTKRQGLTDGRTISLEIRCKKVLTKLRCMQIINYICIVAMKPVYFDSSWIYIDISALNEFGLDFGSVDILIPQSSIHKY